MTKSNLKNQLRRHFSDVIVITSPNKRHKIFPFSAPSNQNFWLRQCWEYARFKKAKYGYKI